MKLPAYFLAHGSPMTILEMHDVYNKKLRELREMFVKARGIIVVSGHGISNKTVISGSENPKTIYDFSGFPRELYEINPDLRGDAIQSKEIAKRLGITVDTTLGFDHGTWGILTIIGVGSAVPVFQIAMNSHFSLKEHFTFAQKLQVLREEGYIIVGSGGLVHNLGNFSMDKKKVFSWARELEHTIKKLVLKKEYGTLLDIKQIPNYERAIPEESHYIPLLYFLGSLDEDEKINVLHEEIQLGSISMLSFFSMP